MTRYLRWRVYAPRENQKKTLPIQKNANFKLAEFSQTYLKQGSTKKPWILVKNLRMAKILTDTNVGYQSISALHFWHQLLGVGPKRSLFPVTTRTNGWVSTPLYYQHTRNVSRHQRSAKKCRADVCPALPHLPPVGDIRIQWGMGDTGWRTYTYRIRQRGLPVLPYRNTSK